MENDELERVEQTVLRVLLSDPRRAMPVWGWRGICQGIRGEDKEHLLEAVYRLQERGLVGVTPTSYRGRPGVLVSLLDPLAVLPSPSSNRPPRTRDRAGRYVSEGNDNERAAG